MERKFIVSTPSETIRLDDKGRGDAIFTVANQAGRAERVLVRVVPIGDTNSQWLTIAGNVEREFPAGGSEQVVVSVNVPAGTAAGRYRFRLDVVSAQRGSEDAETGPAVSFEFAPMKINGDDGRWWKWIAAVALIAVIGIFAWLKCRPEPVPVPEPEPPPVVERVALKTFWNQERGDNMTIATPDSEGVAKTWGYQFARSEGYVFKTEQPGTVPLKLYFHQDRGDFFTTAAPLSEAAAKEAKYAFQRIEGYVYPAPQTGTVPLTLFWSPSLEETYTTGTAEGEAAARAGDWSPVRVEGYIFTSPR